MTGNLIKSSFSFNYKFLSNHKHLIREATSGVRHEACPEDQVKKQQQQNMTSRIVPGLRLRASVLWQHISKTRPIVGSTTSRSVHYLLSNPVCNSTPRFLPSLSAGASVLKEQKRFKKRGKKETRQEEPDTDEEEEDEELEGYEDQEVVGKGYNDRIISVNSLRLDTVLKAASNFGRAKIDEYFFDHRIRVNEETAVKKAEYVVREDQIDLIRGRNPDNPDFIDINRYEILDIPDISSSTGRVKVKVRCYQKMTIENYANNPFGGSRISTDEDKFNYKEMREAKEKGIDKDD